jgi:hypothetical protein
MGRRYVSISSNLPRKDMTQFQRMNEMRGLSGSSGGDFIISEMGKKATL